LLSFDVIDIRSWRIHQRENLARSPGCRFTMESVSGCHEQLQIWHSLATFPSYVYWSTWWKGCQSSGNYVV